MVGAGVATPHCLCGQPTRPCERHGRQTGEARPASLASGRRMCKVTEVILSNRPVVSQLSLEVLP
jgi:hypothetical protein